jgi:hypothetical protein
MSESDEAKRETQFQFGIADILWLTAAVAAGCACGVRSNWIIGVFVGDLLIVYAVTRHRRYASVPGAAVGVLFAWLLLPVDLTPNHLFFTTAFWACVGASFNALLVRQYAAGAFGGLTVLLVYWIAVRFY